MYFVKLTSKFETIGLLDDPGGKKSSPEDFICGLDLSNGLSLRPRKEKSRFGCFWTSQWAFGNPTFSQSTGIHGQKMIKNQSP
jgi:hypothetical protein